MFILHTAYILQSETNLRVWPHLYTFFFLVSHAFEQGLCVHEQKREQCSLFSLVSYYPAPLHTDEKSYMDWFLLFVTCDETIL